MISLKKPKKFFRKQKLVDFKKIWFYDESIKKNHQSPDTKYLSEFEEKYGIKLWKLAANERIFIFNEFYQFSTNEILSIIEQECKFYENILDEINPDYVLMVRPYFHYDTIFYQLCVAKGIQVLDLDTSRFPNRSVISSKNPSYNLEKYENNGERKKSELEIKYEEFTDPNKIRSFEDLQKYRKNNLAFGKGTDYENTYKDFISTGLEYFFTSNKIINRNYKYFGRSKFKVLINYINDIFRQRRRERFIEKKLKSLRWCGISNRKLTSYDVTELGNNYYMNEFSAAIGLVQLKKINKLTKMRQKIAKKYFNEIDIGDKMLFDKRCSYHLYWICVKNRNKFRKLLNEKNIETGTHYKPIHTFTLYKKNFSLPITEKISNEIVTIPIHPNLKSHEIDKIISTINKSI